MNYNVRPDITSSGSTHPELKGPAIGLIVTGSLNALLAVLVLLSGLVRLVGGGPAEQITDDAERLGYVFGTLFGYGIGALSLVVSPVIVAGGVAMLRGRSLKLARSAAILALLPVTSCCWVAGLPIGIWALIVLKKPEVAAFFQQSGPEARPMI